MQGYAAKCRRPQGNPAIALGALHYVMLVKGFQIEPIVYLCIVIMLLALRQSGFKWPVAAFKTRAVNDPT